MNIKKKASFIVRLTQYLEEALIRLNYFMSSHFYQTYLILLGKHIKKNALHNLNAVIEGLLLANNK